jgi:hypothetical protein
VGDRLGVLVVQQRQAGLALAVGHRLPMGRPGDRRAVLAAALGGVQRRVGLGEQLVARLAVAGKEATPVLTVTGRPVTMPATALRRRSAAS